MNWLGFLDELSTISWMVGLTVALGAMALSNHRALEKRRQEEAIRPPATPEAAVRRLFDGYFRDFSPQQREVEVARFIRQLRSWGYEVISRRKTEDRPSSSEKSPE